MFEFLHEVVNFFEEWWVYLLTAIIVLRTIAFFNKRRVSIDTAVATVNHLLQAVDNNDTVAFESKMDTLFNNYCLVDYFILFMAHTICIQCDFFSRHYFDEFYFDKFEKCLELVKFEKHEIIKDMEYLHACCVLLTRKRNYYLCSSDKRDRYLSTFAFSLTHIITRR